MKKILLFVILTALSSAAGTDLAWAYPDAVIQNIDLSTSLQRLRMHRSERFLFGLTEGGRELLVLDTLTFGERSRVSLTKQASDFAFSQEGDRIYLLRSDSQTIGWIDLIEPLEISAEEDEIALPDGERAFDALQASEGTGNERLVLSDRGENRIYFFDPDTEEFLAPEGEDYFQLNFDPIGIDVTTNDRLAVLGPTGQVDILLLSSGLRAAATQDLDSKADTENFQLVRSGVINSLNYLAFVNDVSPGAVFLANLLTSTDELGFVDADSSQSGIDPIQVGEGVSEVVFGSVSRPEDSTQDTAPYLFVSNGGDRTLSVVDLSDLDSSDLLEPFQTIADIEGVSKGGALLTSAEEGYLYLQDPVNSRIRVLADHPRLTLSGLPDAPVGTDTLTFDVESSESGTLKVLKYDGGDLEPVSNTEGNVLFREDVAADASTTVSLDLSNFEEGKSLIALFLEKEERLARNGFYVERDTPPPTPTGFDLTFGDGKVFVSWNGVSVEDLSHYLVHFGEGSTDAGSNGQASPIRVDHPETRLVLEPLVNGVEISVRVQSVDSNGNTSDFTDTLSETPEETLGLLEQVNESGGCRVGGSSLLLSLFLLLGLAFFRHKRVLEMLFLVLAIFPQAAAWASEGSSSKNTWRSSASFEVGFFLPSDDLVENFFGRAGNEVFSLRYAIEWRNLETGMSAGVLSESAALRGVTSGRESGERMRLVLVPLEFSTQYNLRFWSRQLFLPFARVGYSLIHFDLSEPDQSESGWKHGVQTSFGVRWMLGQFTAGKDTLDLLGLEDFYLEFLAARRWQLSDGLDFGGWIFHPAIGVSF